jgi:ABC-type nitrate/sulfonate/bicarbonate transport system substrate-binding protein
MSTAAAFRPRWLRAGLVHAAMLLTAALGGCGDSATENGARVLRYQGSPNQVIFPELAEDLGYLSELKLEYRGGVLGGPENLQALAAGEIDFASAFNGSTVKLAAAGVDLVSLVASYGSDRNTYIGFYVLQDSPIHGARDLIGRKVAVNTVGAHHEFALRDYLQRGGLSAAEVAQVEMVVLPPINFEQTLRAEQIDVAVLQSFFRDRALERGGLRLLFTDVELWGEFTAGYYVTTRKLFESRPEAYAAFVAGTAKAIEWARETPREEVVDRMAAIIEKRGRNESVDIIRYWLSTGIPEPGGVVEASKFQMWVDWLVQRDELPNGKVDVARMVDNRYNPYRRP